MERIGASMADETPIRRAASKRSRPRAGPRALAASQARRRGRLSAKRKPETMPRPFRPSRGAFMSDAIAFLSRAIEQGQGLDQADIVLKGGRIFDLVGGELMKSDVAICSDRIVGTLGEYRGRLEIDVGGKVVVPGFIDSHCHVE